MGGSLIPIVVYRDGDGVFRSSLEQVYAFSFS